MSNPVVVTILDICSSAALVAVRLTAHALAGLPEPNVLLAPGASTMWSKTLLTFLEQKKNILSYPGNADMSRAAQSLQADRYDQAVAMCNGNLRSTIRALIMANEYLERELRRCRRMRSPVARGKIAASKG